MSAPEGYEYSAIGGLLRCVECGALVEEADALRHAEWHADNTATGPAEAAPKAGGTW